MFIQSQIKKLNGMISPQDMMRLSSAAEKAQELENKYVNKTKYFYNKIDDLVEDYIMRHGELPKDIDFAELFMNHSFEVQAEALKISKRDVELYHHSKGGPPKKLAKKKKKKTKAPPRARVNTSFIDLMRRWDEYRQTKKPTRRVKSITSKIQKEYLKKTQSVWKQYSSAFRDGDIETKTEIAERVKQAGRTTYARAKTIVETETTYYYNKTRKEFYDKSPDVTHYLFVSIRDKATTKWCKTRKGLVYEKGSKFIKEETPPIHWNCRSEILPLTPQNPVHKKLIDDKSLRRENNKPEPLPSGWNGR